MDKFGIFNLLNSFLKTNGENSPKTFDDSTDKNKDLLSTISSVLSGNSTPNPPQKENSQPMPPPHSLVPLQSQMLSTMISHDEFIKRVNKSNDTNNSKKNDI